MNFRKKLLSLLLAAALMLSLCACSNTEEPEAPVEPSPEVTDSTVLPEDFVVDTSVEDLCLATAGIPGDFELFTINGKPVSARAYLYWLAYNISYLDSYYGIVSTLGTDASLTAYVKTDSLNATAYYFMIQEKCEEMGLELSEEAHSSLETNLALSIAMTGGEDAFADELRKAGLDMDTFLSIHFASYYYQLLLDKLHSELTDQEVLTYIEENDVLSAKHILLLTKDMTTGEALDEATVAQKKAQAEDILSRLQASDDLAADFDALMHEYSEDTGLSAYPDGYLFTAGEMVTEFEDTTRALEFGQMSGIVESPYGYHIILRQDPNSEAVRQEYSANKLETQLQTWVGEADIGLTDEYNSLDPALFYAKFAAYQEAFIAEEEAAQTETQSSAEGEG